MKQKDAMSQVVEAVVAKDTTIETVVKDIATGDVKSATSDIKKVDVGSLVKEVGEVVLTDVNGKTVSLTCCGGWVWSLKIARETTVSSPPKTTGSV